MQHRGGGAVSREIHVNSRPPLIPNVLALTKLELESNSSPTVLVLVLSEAVLVLVIERGLFIADLRSGETRGVSAGN